MEKKSKLLRLPRSLLSTLTSCRTNSLLSDVTNNHRNNLLSSSPLLRPPSPLPFSSSSCPSLCRPTCPQTFDHMVRQNCILSARRNRRRNHKTTNRGRTRFGRKLRSEPLTTSGEDCFSSDDERETETESETLFSSSRSFISLSSDLDSTGSGRAHGRRRPPSARRREARRRRLEEKVKGSFAVVKRSSDPYNDFRTSMVEMIMEKQIFGEKELHELLECFLALNPASHHRTIVEVFAEICEALFSKLC